MQAMLSERAMISRLTIRQWSARKLDRKVTDKVNADHHAHADAGRYNKRLISKDALADLAKVASAARAAHYARTLPWHDEGGRILSAVGYLAYSETMRGHRAEFDLAAQKFAAGYADFVQDARARLNGMFNESDYPPAAEIDRMFSFGTAIDPMPQAADFRVTIGAAQADAIRADIEARSREAIAKAMRDVWQRVFDHVGHMADRLKTYKPADGKGDKAEGIFRDSLVENVRDLAQLLPSLNITGDATLARIAERMAADLCRDDAAVLRDNASARESVAEAADRILADVSDFLA